MVQFELQNDAYFFNAELWLTFFFYGQYSENSEQGILNGPILSEKVAFQEHVFYFVSGLLGFNVEFGAPTRVL